MLIALLMLLQVVQANDFVSFEVCYLDTQAHPWEFREHPEGYVLHVRRGQILTVVDSIPHDSGIDCVKICSAHGCKYVRGTVDSVMEILMGPENAGEESRKQVGDWGR